MGFYFNPMGQDKERFLNTTYTPVHAPDYSDVPADHYAVCLVNNGAFHAAAIAFSSDEFNVFAAETRRPTAWYYVPRADMIAADPSLTKLI